MASSAVVIVGSSFAASDALLAYPWMGGQALRYGAAALLLLVLFRRALPLPSRGDAVRLVFVAGLGAVGFNLCVLAALEQSDPAVLGVVVGAVPIVLALAAAGRPDPRVVRGALLVTGAVVLVEGGGATATNALGLMFCAGALFGEVAFSVLAAPVVDRIGPRATSAYTCVLAAAMFLVLALAVDGPSAALAAPTGTEALALLYLAGPVTAGAFVLWYSGVQSLGVDRAGLFAGLFPVAALISGAVLGVAEPTFVSAAGCGLAGLGVAYGLRRGAPAAEDYCSPSEEATGCSPSGEVVPAAAVAPVRA